MNLVEYYIKYGRPAKEKRFLESFRDKMSRHEFYEMMKTYHKIYGGKVDIYSINLNPNFEQLQAYEIGEGTVDIYTGLEQILGEE